MSPNIVRSRMGAAGALAAACLTVVASAQQKQQPPQAGAAKDFVLPSPTRITLANGLPLTMVPFGQVPMVSLRLVVAGANVHEARNEIWLADLTGNMMREGTTTRTADAVAREFASMGGELAVSVSPDTTSLTATVLSERAADAVKLMAEVTERPRLPEADLERVKGNMLRNLAIQKASPQSIAQEKFYELVYGDHPYGRLFPTEAMLKGYTIDQVRMFHRKHFNAASARLYVAGVFDAKALEAAARQAFDGWDRGTVAASPQVTPAPDRRFALLDRPDAPQSTLLIGMRIPAPSHQDWIALEVTDAILGGAFGSRIVTNIREDKGYSYSPFSSLQAHPGIADWVEQADVTTKVTGESVKEILHEVDRLRKDQPSADELRGIQNNLAGIFLVQNASRTGVIGRLVFVDRYGLGDSYLSSYVKRVMAVTPEDVRRIANQYFTPDTMTIVVVGDVKTVKEQLTPWSGR